MGHEAASRVSRRQSGTGTIVPTDPQGPSLRPLAARAEGRSGTNPKFHIFCSGHYCERSSERIFFPPPPSSPRAKKPLTHCSELSYYSNSHPASNPDRGVKDLLTLPYLTGGRRGDWPQACRSVSQRDDERARRKNRRLSPIRGKPQTPLFCPSS
jgi:hypothetical protein